MASAIVHFRSPRQPAHYVRAGRGYKFVGGRLAVRAEDAERLRAYALANPALGIIEEPTLPHPPRRPKGDAGATEGEV